MGGWEYLKPHHATVADLIELGQVTTNELTWRFLVTLRNPLDVLVTQWRYSSQQRWPFTAYLGAMKGKPEMEFPMRGVWKDATHFLYYEHLSEDWRHFFPKGPPLEHRPSDRTAEKGHWSDHYKDIPSWVEYLLDRYQSFFHTFGYRVDPMSKQSCWIDETVRFRRRGC